MTKISEIMKSDDFKNQMKKNEVFISKNDFHFLFKKYSGPDFIYNNDNTDIIKTISRYFLGLGNFNEFGKISNEASLNKGICVFGDNGVGKSYLFNIINKIGLEYRKISNLNTRLNFAEINAKLFVNTYMKEVKNSSSNFSIERFYRGNLYIGDLGQETLTFNKNELIGDVIYERNRGKGLTFITTNLPPSEISNRYGNAIGDRLLQDFNIIKWTGESFRDKN